MPGTLDKNKVIVTPEPEANSLYNKGGFGTPMRGGALELTLMEAHFLVESKRLDVLEEGRRISEARLFAAASRAGPDYEARYIVYRDLRKRGYLVKEADDRSFHLYPRGGFPGKTPSSSVVLPYSERADFEPSRLIKEAGKCAEWEKTLVVGVVDEEGDVTFYDVDTLEPEGKVAPPERYGNMEIHLLTDRAVIWDEAAAKGLHAEPFFGKVVGNGLHLSLLETLYLSESLGVSMVDGDGREVTRASFLEAARRVQPDFELRYGTFKDLRDRGLVAKTGYKYGDHFRVYRSDARKGHAPYLVHSLPADYSRPWPEVSGIIRVAHSVKKQILFHGGGKYLRFRRTRL